MCVYSEDQQEAVKGLGRGTLIAVMQDFGHGSEKNITCLEAKQILSFWFRAFFFLVKTRRLHYPQCNSVCYASSGSCNPKLLAWHVCRFSITSSGLVLPSLTWHGCDFAFRPQPGYLLQYHQKITAIKVAPLIILAIFRHHYKKRAFTSIHQARLLTRLKVNAMKR